VNDGDRASPTFPWGPGIRQIHPSELGHFGLDEQNRLHWDGQIIHTSAALNLTPKQNRFAKILGVAALAGSLATIANAAASWLNYLRQRQMDVPALQVTIPAISALEVVLQPPRNPETVTKKSR
jgi:hypothetical protein